MIRIWIRKLTILLLVLLQIYQVRVHGLIGYDCGSSHLNITTLSLLDVGQCIIPEAKVNATQVHIQLLQLNDYSLTSVIQCKIEIQRTIYHCGMHSHVSVVTNGNSEYLVEVSRDECQRIFGTGAARIGTNAYLYGLQINQTAVRSITLAGSIANDGSCSGTQYSDPYGSWNDVVVQGIARITLQEYDARINLNANQINLRSGTTCLLTNSHCIDMEGGYTYWNPLPQDNCHFHRYDVLYQGLASKLMDETYEYPQIIYSLSTEDITFALTSKGKQSLCGYVLVRTEHPKLFILEAREGESFTTRKNVAIENLDIFAYVNSKFIYVEKHIRTQMTQLYRDVLTQRCNLEQQILKNALTVAAQIPDEFAYHLMKGPGYMAVVAGEVVHIIKCIPVEVRIRRTQECYHQLPVVKANQSYYLSPRTHILLKTGTQLDCNSFVPPMYLLGDGWYKLLPGPVETIPPIIMKPMTQPTWKYTSPSSLATSGIYTDEDLSKLREHIMFPAERASVLDIVARGVAGQAIANQGISLSNMLDERSIRQIVDSTWNRIWGSFITFGTASAGLLGIYFASRTIKLIIDTIIHGYALHTVYGWSIHLIGALWDSVTHLLLHLAKGTATSQTKQTGQGPSPSSPNEPDVENGQHMGIIKQQDLPRRLYPDVPKVETSRAELQGSTESAQSKRYVTF